MIDCKEISIRIYFNKAIYTGFYKKLVYIAFFYAKSILFNSIFSSIVEQLITLITEGLNIFKYIV